MNVSRDLKNFCMPCGVNSIGNARLRDEVTFSAQVFIEIRTWGNILPACRLASGHLYNREHSRRASWDVFLYTQLLFLDILDANPRS
jgi:hypothetical protein